MLRSYRPQPRRRCLHNPCGMGRLLGDCGGQVGGVVGHADRLVGMRMEAHADFEGFPGATLARERASDLAVCVSDTAHECLETLMEA